LTRLREVHSQYEGAIICRLDPPQTGHAIGAPYPTILPGSTPCRAEPDHNWPAWVTVSGWRVAQSQIWLVNGGRHLDPVCESLIALRRHCLSVNRLRICRRFRGEVPPQQGHRRLWPEPTPIRKYLSGSVPRHAPRSHPCRLLQERYQPLDVSPPSDLPPVRRGSVVSVAPGPRGRLTRCPSLPSRV
jgi:hypothetical protein